LSSFEVAWGKEPLNSGDILLRFNSRQSKWQGTLKIRRQNSGSFHQRAIYQVIRADRNNVAFHRELECLLCCAPAAQFRRSASLVQNL